MDNKTTSRDRNIGTRYLPSEILGVLDVETIHPHPLDSGLLESASPFFGNRKLEECALITEEFDHLKSSRNLRMQANTISELWPYSGARALDQLLNYNRDYDYDAPSWEDFLPQNAFAETSQKIPFFDQISSRLKLNLSDEEFSDNSVSWLQKNIRSLFDSMAPTSSSIAELNLIHREVHFVGTSFKDTMRDSLCAVMVSSGINAQIIFLEDIRSHLLFPFDSMGLRKWIMELSRETPSDIEKETQGFSKVEASSLLVLLEFVHLFTFYPLHLVLT
ncbi:hypothetical protein DL96DRAFT_597039 [Flagelloscypha sp. PMI_526]|nr:hypothetical protein DL96DRAFT_597039 [Flagelloscypha sp. PMI_526]